MGLKGILAATTILVASTGGVYASTTFTNGSFEQVDNLEKNGLNRGSFGVYQNINGWATGSGAGIELQNNDTLPGTNANPEGRDAQQGEWYVELDSDINSSMSQDITFSTAGQYLLTFFYAPRTATMGDNGIDWKIGSSFGNVDSVIPASWTKVTSLFSASANEVLTLSFAATGLSNSLGGFIDNVSIAPVPLPAAGILLFGAVAGLGGIASRRRKQAAA